MANIYLLLNLSNEIHALETFKNKEPQIAVCILHFPAAFIDLHNTADR